ncbi:MAG: hypothetical protein RLZZ329_1350, partial [Pseudomonadota bacterium]
MLRKISVRVAWRVALSAAAVSISSSPMRMRAKGERSSC